LTKDFYLKGGSMKIKVNIIYSALVTIPDIVAEHTPGGAETVLKEVRDKLKTEMAMKYGKDVSVEAELLEE